MAISQNSDFSRRLSRVSMSSSAAVSQSIPPATVVGQELPPVAERISNEVPRPRSRTSGWAALRTAVASGRLADNDANNRISGEATRDPSSTLAQEGDLDGSRPTVQFVTKEPPGRISGELQPDGTVVVSPAPPPALLPLDVFLANGSPPPPAGYVQRVIMHSSDGTVYTTAPYVETVPIGFDRSGEQEFDDLDDFDSFRRTRSGSFSASSDTESDDGYTIKSTTTYGAYPKHPKGFFARIFDSCTPNYDYKPFPQWRQTVRVLMNDPHSSKLARAIDIYIVTLIVLSTITMCIVTVPFIHDNPQLAPWFFGWECFISTSFLIEIILRWIGMKYWREFFSVLNLIDCLATFPFFIEIIVEAALGADIIQSTTGLAGLEVLRVLRAFRLFRIFKIARKSGKMKLLGQALRESWDGVIAFALVFLIFMVFSSTLIYYAEQSQAVYSNGSWIYVGGASPGVVSDFSSIPATFWFSVVSLTTTGYGDVTPRTIAGRIVAMMMLVASLFVLAFPLTMVTLSYAAVVRRDQAQKLTRQLRKRQARMNRQKAREEEALRKAQEKEASGSANKNFLRKNSLFRDVALAAFAASSFSKDDSEDIEVDDDKPKEVERGVSGDIVEQDTLRTNQSGTPASDRMVGILTNNNSPRLDASPEEESPVALSAPSSALVPAPVDSETDMVSPAIQVPQGIRKVVAKWRRRGESYDDSPQELNTSGQTISRDTRLASLVNDSAAMNKLRRTTTVVSTLERSLTLDRSITPDYGQSFGLLSQEPVSFGTSGDIGDEEYYQIPQVPVEKALKRSAKGSDGRLPGVVHLKGLFDMLERFLRP